MQVIRIGRYRVRIASSKSDIHASQQLRYLAFGTASAETEIDSDRFDAFCTHFLVEEVTYGQLLCSFRMLPLPSGQEFSHSYSAQFYGFSDLDALSGPMVELGRFCLHPDAHDPDIIRTAWAAMTRYVDENNVKFMFGCASFFGNDARQYQDAFALLNEKHLAPKKHNPIAKANNIYRFDDDAPKVGFDRKQALQQMPPLLRTYLAMGGWVSDHAVVDTHMNTLHVFIGLEIAAIPAARKQWLRALTPA